MMSAAVTQRPAFSSGAATANPDTLRRVAPLLVGVVVAYAALLSTGTPLVSVLAYSGYFGLAVVLPGTLLHRWLRGFAESLLSDVTWGAVTGLVSELFVWAALTALHVNRLLWVWPVVVVAAFVGLPRLRRFWRRPAGAPRTSPLLAWGVCGAFALATAYVTRWYFGSYPLPPSGRPYHTDIPYNLGFAATATHSIPTSNEALAFHWVADAHLAAANLISGVPLPTIVLRTWVLSVVFVIVATTACLGARVSRRPGVGVVAALLILVSPLGIVLWPHLSISTPLLYPLSDSLVFSIGLTALLMMILVDAVRRQRVGIGSVVLFVATALVAVGTKPSVIPDVLGGLGLLCVLLAWKQRRWPSHTLLLLGSLLIVVLLVSVPTVSKSAEAGSGVLPFAVVAFSGPTTTAMVGLVLLADLLATWLLAVPVVVALRARELRGDHTAQLLGCVVAVGFACSVLIDHPGLSEFYFWLSAVPFAAILTAWAGAALLDRATLPRRQLFSGFGLVALVAAGAQVYVGRWNPEGRWSGLALLGVILVCAVLAARYAGLGTGRLGFAVLSTVVALMASAVPAFFVVSLLSARPTNENPHLLAQSEAAQWVAQHVPSSDVVATNSHCAAGPTRPHCDASAYWLSGFGQRAVLVGGWAWSLASHRNNGVDGYGYMYQPYSNPTLLALNDGAFTHPTPSALAELYSRYHVRWLVADRMAGPVSPRLANFGDPAYVNAWVTVYRLDRPSHSR